MARSKKKERTKYERDIEKVIADYIAATGDRDWTRIKVAAWAIDQGRWEQCKTSAVKELAKEISRVARTITFYDEETGERPRKYHAWPLGPFQPTFWSAMEDITRDNMERSVSSRAEKLAGGMTKVVIDADYFNKHHNPGDPIVVETDLTAAVQEKRQPALYDDVAPEDGEDS